MNSRTAVPQIQRGRSAARLNWTGDAHTFVSGLQPRVNIDRPKTIDRSQELSVQLARLQSRA